MIKFCHYSTKPIITRIIMYLVFQNVIIRTACIVFRDFMTSVNNEEKSYNKRYLPLSFSKHNQASPKLVYSEETSSTVMRAKFQLISMQNAKVLNKNNYNIERAITGKNT